MQQHLDPILSQERMKFFFYGAIKTAGSVLSPFVDPEDFLSEGLFSEEVGLESQLLFGLNFPYLADNCFRILRTSAEVGSILLATVSSCLTSDLHCFGLHTFRFRGGVTCFAQFR